MIKLKLPYIAGFLAFREVPSLLHILNKLKIENPDIFPQVLMVDGNGLLHMRDCGQACHLGVLADIPCIGVAKHLLWCDGITQQYVDETFRRAKASNRDCEAVKLVGKSGASKAFAFMPKGVRGSCMLYVSPGHRIDLQTSLELVRACMKGNKLPEPVHLADKLSRDFLALNYEQL